MRANRNIYNISECFKSSTSCSMHQKTEHRMYKSNEINGIPDQTMKTKISVLLNLILYNG